MMKCPICSKELIHFSKVQEDGTIKYFYAHPEGIERCELSEDGTSLEIVNPVMLNKFQEIIKEKGIETPLNSKSPLNSVQETKILLETNEEKLKNRLVTGEITIEEFRTIKSLLLEKW